MSSEPAVSVNEVGGWRRLALRLLALLVRGWGRTLRIRADDASRALLTRTDEPLVFVLWHNRLFPSAEMFRRFRGGRRTYALVSASRDGAWLAAFYRMCGIEPVRGSSSNLGREAARALIDVLRAGHDIGITPDGPRGPMYTLEGGALVVSRRSSAPMILVGMEFGRAARLGSWDRFYLPCPFSRIVVRCACLPPKGADGAKPDAEEVRAKLLALNPDAPQHAS